MISCSDPKKVEIPNDIEAWESDKDFKAAVEKLNDEEKELFVAYTIRMKFGEAFGGEGIKKGLTIGEAIKLQQEWEKEQAKEDARRKQLAAELQKTELEILKQMNEALTVTLLSLKFKKANPGARIYSDYFSIKIGFRNNADKDILGAKGVVVLKDIFGDTIKRIGLSNDDGVKANSSKTWSGTLDYNRFRDEDNKLRTTEFSKIKFEWEPDVYIFTDGSKLEMPK